MKALSRLVDVVPCPMALSSQAGHPPDSNINDLIAPAGDEAFYLGSVDQLFRGLAKAPMATAIWADFVFSENAALVPCLRLFDVVFSAQRDAVPGLRRAGIPHVEWLPFAFDVTLSNDPAAEKVYDVGFVGNLTLPASRDERTALLGRLERKFRMNDVRMPVFGDDMMRVYNQSRIVVNIPFPGSFNMRTFEAMASGALLITKQTTDSGQDELFSSGRHLVTYCNADDLIEKVDYYLRHDRERQAIADEGRREVLAHHTYDHRAARVLEVMRAAPRARTASAAAETAAYAVFYDHLGRWDLLGRLAFERGVPIATRVRILARAALKCGRRALRAAAGGFNQIPAVRSSGRPASKS